MERKPKIIPHIPGTLDKIDDLLFFCQGPGLYNETESRPRSPKMKKARILNS